MDREMDKGKKKEAMNPIIMEEDQINQIMEKLEICAAEYPTNIK
jgi:hypothetical protein